MGVYGEYLDQPIAQNFRELTAERKKQLRAISEVRGGRDVLVFAADLNNHSGLSSIGYVDILPISDQLANLKGTKLDLILETPGGLGEAAEDIVRLIRGKYDELAVIVPGWAKSAGTIMVMAADEILMGPTSALGPIDAQITWQGKRFSADAFLEGINKIKKEVTDTGTLNKAYIPILQGISPGEIQSAENALKFAERLVTKWLAEYKFRPWTHHSSTGKKVTQEERQQRANEIANRLCDHGYWLTHGRSIRLDDLKEMRLLVTDYTSLPALSEAIARYYALLQMTFSSNIYKIYETVDSQIIKFETPAVRQQQGPVTPLAGAKSAILDLACKRCGAAWKIQANFGKARPVEAGCQPFPPDNRFKCPNCNTEANLEDLRRKLEAQAKQPVV
jgi:ClpP class serine protease